MPVALINIIESWVSAASSLSTPAQMLTNETQRHAAHILAAAQLQDGSRQND
jgi:hypothetical protein